MARRALMGGVAALLAALALAAPAGASSVKAACVATGEMKFTDKVDPSIGMRLVNGKASWQLPDLMLVCAGVAKGAPDVQILHLAASGWYFNVVCGTGPTVGTISSLDGPAKYQSLLVGRKISFGFLAGQVVFFWHRWAKPELPLPYAGDVEGKDLSPKRWQPAGHLQAFPPTAKFSGPPDPVTGHCTKALMLAGTILIDD